MHLSRQQIYKVIRLLPEERNEAIQQQLVATLARWGTRYLREAVKAGCSCKTRQMIVEASMNPELLLWMFRRERSKTVRNAIFNKLLELGSSSALQKLADIVLEKNHRSLYWTLARRLAEKGFEQEQPVLVWRALQLNAAEAIGALVEHASSYVRLSELQQRILLVALRHPEVPEYHRECLFRHFQARRNSEVALSL